MRTLRTAVAQDEDEDVFDWLARVFLPLGDDGGDGASVLDTVGFQTGGDVAAHVRAIGAADCADACRLCVWSYPDAPVVGPFGATVVVHNLTVYDLV